MRVIVLLIIIFSCRPVSALERRDEPADDLSASIYLCYLLNITCLNLLFIDIRDDMGRIKETLDQINEEQSRRFNDFEKVGKKITRKKKRTEIYQSITFFDF